MSCPVQLWSVCLNGETMAKLPLLGLGWVGFGLRDSKNSSKFCVSFQISDANQR